MNVKRFFRMPADVARAEELARTGGPFPMLEQGPLDPEVLAPPILRPLVRRTVETVPVRLTPDRLFGVSCRRVKEASPDGPECPACTSDPIDRRTAYLVYSCASGARDHTKRP